MYNIQPNESNPLLTKTFSELGVDKIQDVDYLDLLFYLRDMMHEAGTNLVETSEDADEKCIGHDHLIAAMYVGMAIDLLFGSASFSLAEKK